MKYYFLLIFLSMPCYASFSQYINRAKAFSCAQHGDWLHAHEKLVNELAKDPCGSMNASLLYDAGVAAYRCEKYEQARAYFRDIDINNIDNDQLRKNAYFNAGNAAAMLHDYQDALAWYDKLLMMDPDDAQAKHNREKIQELLNQEKQSKNDDKKQKDQQKKNDSNDSSEGDADQKSKQSKNNKSKPSQDQKDNKTGSSQDQSDTSSPNESESSPSSEESASNDKNKKSSKDGAKNKPKHGSSSKNNAQDAENNENDSLEQGEDDASQKEDLAHDKSDQQTKSPSTMEDALQKKLEEKERDKKSELKDNKEDEQQQRGKKGAGNKTTSPDASSKKYDSFKEGDDKDQLISSCQKTTQNPNEKPCSAWVQSLIDERDQEDKKSYKKRIKLHLQERSGAQRNDKKGW